MKVLVLGAGGKTGRLVVEKAAQAGHQVTALLHEPDPHETFTVEVKSVHGDARNPARLDQVMAGQNAVIDAIGGSKPFMESDLEAGTAKVVIDVMKRNGVKRLIAISALGVGDSKEHATWFYEHLLVPLYLGGVIRDKARMEEVVEHSGLDFVIVRPPLLKDSAETGQIEEVTGTDEAHSITRADLAQFLVDQLTSDGHLGRQVTIANR
jgi:putative NADH-flavin reductase